MPRRRWRWKNPFLRWPAVRFLRPQPSPSDLIQTPEKGSVAVVIKTLLGTWLMVVFLLFDVAYYTSLATRNHWPKVGVRIVWVLDHSYFVADAGAFIDLISTNNRFDFSGLKRCGRKHCADAPALGLARFIPAASAATATMRRPAPPAMSTPAPNAPRIPARSAATRLTGALARQRLSGRFPHPN